VTSPSLPDEIRKSFIPGAVQDDRTIDTFAELFGASNHTNRLRLDDGTFINVIAILLYLPHSRHKEKALFAFTVWSIFMS
jgi:hypothetical protein